MATTAYLPDTGVGRDVLYLIQWAFRNGRMFYVSKSPRGEDDRVMLGDIPLKRKTYGGR